MRPDRRELRRRRRSDDEADRPAGPPVRRPAGHPRPERLGGRAELAGSGRDARGPGARRRPGSTSGTGRRRSGRSRSRSGSTPRSPRYGLTVTASAPSRSKSATAWRAAVDPMSPRLASATTGRSSGIAARRRSRAASPSAPNASKKARFGLTAAAYGPAASGRAGRTPRARAGRARSPPGSAEPGRGRARGRGRCRPRPTARRAARGRSPARR